MIVGATKATTLCTSRRSNNDPNTVPAALYQQAAHTPIAAKPGESSAPGPPTRPSRGTASSSAPASSKLRLTDGSTRPTAINVAPGLRQQPGAGWCSAAAVYHDTERLSFQRERPRHPAPSAGVRP